MTNSEDNCEKRFWRAVCGIACFLWCIFFIVIPVMTKGIEFFTTRTPIEASSWSSWSSDEGPEEPIMKKESHYQLEMIKTRIAWGLSNCKADQVAFYEQIASSVCFRNEFDLNITCDYSGKDNHWGIHAVIHYGTQSTHFFIVNNEITMFDTASKTERSLPITNVHTLELVMKTIDEIYLRSEPDYLCCSYIGERNLPLPLYC